MFDFHCMDQVGDFNCNILWTRNIKSQDVFNNLHDFQMVNHFPKSVLLADKKDLYLCYKDMQARFGETEFDYHPDCFTFPEQYEDFIEQLETWKTEGNPKADKKWIFKPSDTSCGEGIFIFDAHDYKKSPLESTWATYQEFLQKLEIDGEPEPPSKDKTKPIVVTSAIISEYLEKPLLFKGFKFDLRIYVLITSFYPLKIYVYREGLVRLATTKYTEFNAAGYDKTSHLTNTTINKLNKTKAALKQYEDDIDQYVMSLSAFFTQLKKEGVDIDLIWNRIYDMIIKTTLSIEKDVSSYTKEHFQKKSKCFELFGFDVLIDKELRPWLLEVNLFPSLGLTNKLDRIVKINLVHNVLNLVGIRDLKTAKCVVSEQKNDFRHLDRKTGVMMNEEENKNFTTGKDQDSDILIKSPSYKKINLRFVEPKLSEEQTETVIKIIEDGEDFDDHAKNYMKKLLESKFKIQIIDALAEFQRKDNFIRIFPSPGSNSYFKYFTHKLEINEELYSFLYE